MDTLSQQLHNANIEASRLNTLPGVSAHVVPIYATVAGTRIQVGWDVEVLIDNP